MPKSKPVLNRRNSAAIPHTETQNTYYSRNYFYLPALVYLGCLAFHSYHVLVVARWEGGAISRSRRPAKLRSGKCRQQPEYIDSARITTSRETAQTHRGAREESDRRPAHTESGGCLITAIWNRKSQTDQAEKCPLFILNLINLSTSQNPSLSL